MDFETIHYEVKEAAASLILSRPARSNALNARMLEELNVAMDLAEADQRVRVVVVTGAGAAFSSGFDLKDEGADGAPSHRLRPMAGDSA